MLNVILSVPKVN